MSQRRFIVIKQEQLITAIGLEDSDMESGSNFGPMAQNTWENGKKERLMVKASSFIQMEIIMKGIGATIKLVVMGSIFMRMGINTKGSGRMTFSMATEKKDGLMGPATKDHIIKVPSTGSDCTNGPTDLNTMAIGITMSLKALESTLGLMGENTEESGKTQTCMESALINGQMDECLQVNMITIKSMATGSTHGLTIESIEAGGKRGSKMD